MNLGIIKRYKAWLIIALIILLIMAVGFFFFFHRYYQKDIKALTDFSFAYDKYDRAISDFSNNVLASNFEGAPLTDDMERKTDEALADLKTKAATRISSLIKNDAKLMSTALEIADLSGKELDSLKVYKSAIAGKNADLNKLAIAFGDLTNKRQTAYARFRELTGQ